MRIGWTREQLTELLDRRIDHLVKQTYTKAPVAHKDLLNFRIGRQPAIDYMLDRTSMRPRELIEFLNCCMECAEGKAAITKTILFKALKSDGHQFTSACFFVLKHRPTNNPISIAFVLGGPGAARPA